MGLWSLCTLTGVMIITNLGILLPSISAEFKLAAGEQGLLSSSAFWGTLALGIPVSWWTARYGPKNLTTVVLVLGTLLVFVQGLAPVFAALLTARLVFGIVWLSMEPARALLIQQWFQDREIVLVIGMSSVMYGIIVGGGLWATPFVLSALGDDWRATYYVFGGVLVVFSLLWVVLGRERITTEYRRRDVPYGAGVLLKVAKYRDLWVAGAGFVGALVAQSAFLTFYPTLMLDTYDMPLRWSGGILAISTIVGGLSALAVSYMVMKMGGRRIILPALGILMASTYLSLTLTDYGPVLIGLAILNGLSWGFFPLLTVVPFQLPGIRPREVAVASAFIMTMTFVGDVLGPMAAGFLHELLGDLREALIIVSFGALSLCVTGIFLRSAIDEAGADRTEIVDEDWRGAEKPLRPSP